MIRRISFIALWAYVALIPVSLLMPRELRLRLVSVDNTDDGLQVSGKVVFEKNCVSCHGADLTAMLGAVKLPGVPLNDAEWKYGGKPMEIFNLITKGSPDIKSGMVAWEPIIGGQKVAQVVSYILSRNKQGEGGIAVPAGAGG